MTQDVVLVAGGVGLESISTHYAKNLNRERIKISNMCVEILSIRSNEQDCSLVKLFRSQCVIASVLHFVAQLVVKHAVNEPRDYVESETVGEAWYWTPKLDSLRRNLKEKNLRVVYFPNMEATFTRKINSIFDEFRN